MYKYYNEKWFEIDKNISIQCMTQKTSYGFRHVAEMRITSGTGANYQSKNISGKACYYNRTWESFEYESVLSSVINKAFNTGAITEEQKNKCDQYIKNGARVEDELKPLKFISMVAKMGEVLHDGQKEKNDFKTRILKTGLENKGLIMPDDWNELDEAEKEKRLNGAIKILE